MFPRRGNFFLNCRSCWENHWFFPYTIRLIECGRAQHPPGGASRLFPWIFPNKLTNSPESYETFQNPYRKYDIQLFEIESHSIQTGTECLLGEVFRVAYCSWKSQKGTSNHDKEMFPNFCSNLSTKTMDLRKTNNYPLKSSFKKSTWEEGTETEFLYSFLSHFINHAECIYRYSLLNDQVPFQRIGR